jgi:type IV pilus assembly protein PilZ
MADNREDADERREHPRDLIELKVEYRRLNAFFADYARNISNGGTFIATDKPLPVGTEFLFKLFIPTLDRPLELRGQVQWLAEAPSEAADEPGMGIRFLYENTRQREVMERIVEKLMVDSLGQLLYSKLMQHSREAREREPGSEDDNG